ncbi:MAG: M23 family metallopeptidase [Rickettsia sp.]|nr:M23 family metallopeptidase [Rickettsia sp.]
MKFNFLNIKYFLIITFLVGILYICSSNLDEKLSNILFPENNSPNSTTKIENVKKIVSVCKGDNFFNILQKEKIPVFDIVKMIALLEKSEGKKFSLSLGQNIIFEYLHSLESLVDAVDKNKLTLQKISIPFGNDYIVNIIKGNNGEFYVDNNKIEYSKMLVKYDAVIKSNFVTSLKKTGLSTSLIIELAQVLNQKINFKKEIQPGDKISVIAEKYITLDRKSSYNGKIIFVSFENKNKNHFFYRYYTPNSEYQFFDENGKTIKTSPLIVPLSFSRISSKFGYRKHPVLGYKKMHKGVDFVAPKNTPIYASGDGVISKKGFNKYSGNFLVIDHKNATTTLYAHINKFAQNLVQGKSVKQGDLVAYVGNTGRSTGSHLHYEVKVNGKNIDPLSIKYIPPIELKNKDLERFNNFRSYIRVLKQKLDQEVELVEADIKELYRFQ